MLERLPTQSASRIDERLPPLVAVRLRGAARHDSSPYSWLERAYGCPKTRPASWPRARIANRRSGTSGKALAEGGSRIDDLNWLGKHSQALKDQQAAVLSAANKLSAVSRATSKLSARALAAYRDAG